MKNMKIVVQDAPKVCSDCFYIGSIRDHLQGFPTNYRGTHILEIKTCLGCTLLEIPIPCELASEIKPNNCPLVENKYNLK